MDFEPAKGGRVAGKGIGSVLDRSDRLTRGRQTFESGLDADVGSAGNT